MARVSIHSIQGQGYVLADGPLRGWALLVPATGDKPAAYRWPDTAATHQDVSRRLWAEGHAVIHVDQAVGVAEGDAGGGGGGTGVGDSAIRSKSR